MCRRGRFLGCIDWDRKNKYADEFEYYKSLIMLRKNHPAFRLKSTELIQKHLEFLPPAGPNMVAYMLKEHAGGDHWKNILVILNGNPEAQSVQLPRGGGWTVVLDEQTMGETGLRSIIAQKVNVPGISVMVLVQE